MSAARVDGVTSVPLPPAPAAAPPSRPGGGRADGRGDEELRQAFIQVGVHSQAPGSSYVEMGDTKVMAACYGPRDPDRRDPFSPAGRLAVDFRAAGAAAAAARAAAGDRGGRGATPAERETAALVAAALAPAVRTADFPRLTADVAITVVDGGGGVADRAAAIVAAALALAAAGVPLACGVGAASFARVGGGRVLLDPSPAEEAAADGAGVVAVTVGGGGGGAGGGDVITQAAVTGAWTPDALEAAVDAAAAAAAAVGGVARGALVASLK